MFDGERGESFREGITVVLPSVNSFRPKIFAMKGFFVPRAESEPRGRIPRPIEAQVPGIRIETRPDAAQKRAHYREKRQRARREAAEAQRVFYERQNQMYERLIAREDAQMKKILSAGAAVLGVLTAFGALGVAVLEGQALIASAISGLEGLIAIAPAVIVETLKGFLSLLALGDPTFTAATVLVGLSLLLAARNAAVSGAKARAQREEYGY